MASIETSVNRPNVPADGTTVTAEIDVEPGEQETDVRRHIALCIDTSGSMEGDNIKRARDGAAWVFGLLADEDYVSIVAFDTEATVILPATRWSDLDRQTAMDHVEELTAGGGTDMYNGLKAAKETLSSSATGPDTVKRLLLLSDGKDNERTPDEFEGLAEAIDDAGIRIQSAGIGTDYNEATIRTLGTAGRGTWTHLEAPGDIEDFFGEAVEQAGSVVAPDAHLDLDVAPGVEVSEVYRALPQAQEVSPEWEANATRVKLPDLIERESQRVVLKIHAPPREPGSEEVLADVQLSARGDTASDQIGVEYTDEQEKLAEHNESVDIDHKQTVIRTELGKGNVEAAETKVEQMTVIHGEDAEAVQEAERQTEIVKEGGRAEQSQATQIVDSDDGIQ
ncbi:MULTISPECIES: vWA domain-containing protein [Halomicrobium]|uniref:von Willebrand factor type A n=2 Tax=Halomicrobium mukohataei TaxID=57705 RepID=C7P2A9_HALMD|nr:MULTISPECIES: VWA domain-containing protein [Halomicrobium]ACV49224.1 von Willebrand factor type A [Halomicrobium mukohataei DSM 12286]QCD64629.1 VWA domain-containing protein [Halomicrobium mukohataei]QFR19436.1 VWA domain-containing protein [Halomicrobium sp. ZPS1]